MVVGPKCPNSILLILSCRGSIDLFLLVSGAVGEL